MSISSQAELQYNSTNTSLRQHWLLGMVEKRVRMTHILSGSSRWQQSKGIPGAMSHRDQESREEAQPGKMAGLSAVEAGRSGVEERVNKLYQGDIQSIIG